MKRLKNRSRLAAVFLTTMGSVSFTMSALATSAPDHGRIFVTNSTTGKIATFDATLGTPVNANFAENLSTPFSLEVYGSSLLVSNSSGTTVSALNIATGTVEKTARVQGLSNPQGLAVSGSSLFVVNSGKATIDKYDAVTGVVAPNFSPITGLTSPSAIAADGGSLLVASSTTTGGITTWKIGKYDSLTGTVLTDPLISGLSNPSAIAIYGGTLFVANKGTGTIQKYYVSTGAPVSATFTTITNLSSPTALAVYGDALYVVNSGTGTIDEYDAVSGAVRFTSLVTGLSGPQGIVVVPTPTALQASTSTTTPPLQGKPTVKITGKKKVITTNPKLSVKGTATGTVTSVTYRIGKKGKWRTASGTSAWKFKATLKLGKNLLNVIANGPGGVSLPVKITIIKK